MKDCILSFCISIIYRLYRSDSEWFYFHSGIASTRVNKCVAFLIVASRIADDSAVSETSYLVWFDSIVSCI